MENKKKLKSDKNKKRKKTFFYIYDTDTIPGADPGTNTPGSATAIVIRRKVVPCGFRVLADFGPKSRRSRFHAFMSTTQNAVLYQPSAWFTALISQLCMNVGWLNVTAIRHATVTCQD